MFEKLKQALPRGDPAAHRDARRLRARHPTLAPNGSESARLRRELWPAYEDYVTNVSKAGWAVSLETSVLLYHVCRATHAADVLDLGSGFSSYVLRHYAQEVSGTVTVTSVDADPAWLQKTEAFLRRHTCAIDGLVAWEQFRELVPESRDIVFHDLASGSLREEAMPLAISHVRRGGVIVFDDAQHQGHRERMYAEGSAAGLDLYGMRRWTRDSIGRWSVLGVRE